MKSERELLRDEYHRRIAEKVRAIGEEMNPMTLDLWVAQQAWPEEPPWPHFEGVQGYVLACVRAFNEEGWRGPRRVYLSPKELECLIRGAPDYVPTGKRPTLFGCELHVRAGG